jgi:hypothetical protein
MNDLERLEKKVFESVIKTNEIHVFDFDDTLVRTGSMIHVTSGDGQKFSLTPRQYAMYIPDRSDSFDFSDFEDLIDPRPVNSTLLKLKMAIRDVGQKNVFILTARGNPSPVQKFLNDVGASGIRVFAVGTSDPKAKAKVVEEEVLSRGIKLVYFYDDSVKNIMAVRELRQDLPGVRIVAVKVG